MTVTRSIGLILTALLLAVAATGTAEQSAPSAEIIAVAPEHDVLASNEVLYLHIRYSSDEPLRFQARASGPGEKKAGAMMNPAPAYPAGDGEAIAWIAFRQAFVPEQISVVVSSHSWTERSIVPVNTHIRWSGQPATQAAPQPEWVSRLSGEQQAVTSQQLQTAQADDGSLDWLIFLMAWSVPGYFLLQGWVWLRWHDGWRKAGLLPLWAGVPAIGHAVFALLMGSNLWPLVMLFVLPVLFLYLVCLFLVRLSKLSTAT